MATYSGYRISAAANYAATTGTFAGTTTVYTPAAGHFAIMHLSVTNSSGSGHTAVIKVSDCIVGIINCATGSSQTIGPFYVGPSHNLTIQNTSGSSVTYAASGVDFSNT